MPTAGPIWSSDFSAEIPNRLRVGDFTYLRC
jgi:hypothetical protein